MTAQVSIVIDSKTGVLTLPASVLGTLGRNGSYRVLLLDPATGETKPVEVGVGLNNNITAEIVSGLNEGDQVVGARSFGGGAATGAGGNRPPGGGLFGGGGGGRFRG